MPDQIIAVGIVLLGFALGFVALIPIGAEIGQWILTYLKLLFKGPIVEGKKKSNKSGT